MKSFLSAYISPALKDDVGGHVKRWVTTLSFLVFELQDFSALLCSEGARNLPVILSLDCVQICPENI